jgi:hypothetical protein
MKQIKEIKSQLKDAEYESEFFKRKFLDEREEMKHAQEFIRDQLVLVDLLLHAADSLAKEVPANSLSLLKYKQIKGNFGIKE